MQHAYTSTQDIWSTQIYRPEQQYEAWGSALSDSFAHWNLMDPAPDRFFAEVQSAHYEDFCLARCLTDPCRGQHTSSHITQSSDAVYTFLIIFQGQELLQIEDQFVLLSPGQAVLWDSTKVMEFHFKTQLEKITVRIPHEKLRFYLREPELYIGQMVDMRQGLGAVVNEYIQSLIKIGAGLTHTPFLAEKTLEMISFCLESGLRQSPPEKTKTDLYKHILRYIDQHLGDETLNPDGIAKAFSISLRALYLLFESQENTVSRYIQSRRIDCCKRDLMSRRCTDSVITIALRWGFNDPAYFSRVFRRHVGMSPSEYRKRSTGL